jgi:hypothetical protein
VAVSSAFGVLSTVITVSGCSRYPDEHAISVVSPHLGGRVDREVQLQKPNFFKRARLANSFRWRLIDSGLDEALADRLTQYLVWRLSEGIR